MYLDYLKERYNEKDFAPYTMEQVASNFELLFKQCENELIKTETGFVAYKLQGDAVIIFDMYVKPEYRSKKEAWKLHDRVLKIATENKKRVAITFTETIGKNNHLGISAVSAAGFLPAYKLSHADMHIKGIL